MPDDVGPRVVADGVRVPSRGRQQSLRPIRGGLADLLGQSSAVLPLDTAQLPAQVAVYPAARHTPDESPADPPVQPLQPSRPARNLVESVRFRDSHLPRGDGRRGPSKVRLQE